MNHHDRPTVLVTGAAGLLGTRVPAWLADDHDLVLTDLHGPAGGSIAPLDVLDRDAVTAAMDGIDAVLHLAIAGSGRFARPLDGAYADEMMRVNVIGTQHVLEAAASSMVTRVVLASSQKAMIGWPRRPGPVDGDQPYRTMDLYGTTKRFVEELGELYARTRQLPVACLRIGEPWPRGGPSDEAFLANPDIRRLLVHFDDIGRAIRCALAARHVLYSVTDVVSSSDRWPRDAAENPIGYRPIWRFEDGKAQRLPARVAPTPSSRPRVAAVVTAFHPFSHAHMILGRWFEPGPADARWGWTGPRTELAGAMIAQNSPTDIGHTFLTRHGVPVYGTVEDALTLGTGSLAVDGVILIGEHGDYPRNRIGQHLYPRKELFDSIVEVFRASGRAVPVFCDKHLSWNWDWASEMCDTAWELRFLLFSGSAIPLCPPEPPLRLPPRTRVEEAVMVFSGSDESSGYHSCELFQSLVEGQAFAQPGVAAVTAWCSRDVWKQMAEGTWCPDLFRRARQHLNGSGRGLCDHAENEAGRDGAARADDKMSAYLVEYGHTRVVHVNLGGSSPAFAAALRLESGEVLVTSPEVHGRSLGFPHFAAMARMIEDTILRGRAPHPLQRSLLTTGCVAAFMQARARPGVRLPTPHLLQPYNIRPC